MLVVVLAPALSAPEAASLLVAEPKTKSTAEAAAQSLILLSAALSGQGVYRASRNHGP